MAVRGYNQPTPYTQAPPVPPQGGGGGGGGGVGGMRGPGGGLSYPGGGGGIPGMPGGGATQIPGGGGGGGYNTQLQGQPAPQYPVPPGPDYGNLQGNLGVMSEFGQGMMDPNSDYFKRLNQAMQAQLGKQSQAAQRAMALRGAQSGFGGGAGPEVMAGQRDIAVAGQEARGEAGANLALQAPQLGMQALGSTFQPTLGMTGQQAQQQQYGQGLGQRQWEFGQGQGVQQQQMAQQQAQHQSQLDMQRYLAELNASTGGF